MNKQGKQLVVLAGGQGTRLANAGITTPKLLLQINESSLLEMIMSEATQEGFTDILWCLGYGHENIGNRILKNMPLNNLLKHELFVEQEQRGTLGALIQARSHLHEDFCIIMGDLLLSRTNLGGIYKSFRQKNEDGRLLVKYTDHPEDSDLVIINKDLKVDKLISYPHTEIPKVPVGNAGIVFLKKKHIPKSLEDSRVDIFKQLIPQMLSDKLEVRATFHQGIIRDIGTPERLRKASIDFFEKIYLGNSTGIFFDRDGTLNVENGHINSESQICLFTETKEILRLAFQKYSKVGVVTNQPVIARGAATIEKVKQINSYLLSLAGLEDDDQIIIKFCPHHPDLGFEGEIPELKINCVCRKPASGMLIEILNENNLRSNETIYVGDSISDLQAAEGAGIRWIHLVIKMNSDCDLHVELSNGECMDRKRLILFLEEKGDI